MSNYCTIRGPHSTTNVKFNGRKIEKRVYLKSIFNGILLELNLVLII